MTIKKLCEDVAVLKNEIKHLRTSSDGVEHFMREHIKKSMTAEEFKPYKKMIYGLYGFITTVGLAIWRILR